jgi:hypothetical protein
MKTSLTLTLIGAACALLVSCGTNGRETIYVTSKAGEPICGAQIVPCDTPKGCPKPVYTDACGRACLPGDSAVYTVKKQDFRPVGGIRKTGQSQHIKMVTGWPN